MNVHFHQETCYLCSGKKIVPKDRRLWHKISKNAGKKLFDLESEEKRLTSAISAYRGTMKFSDHTSEAVVLGYNTVLAKKNDQLASIEAESHAYALVRQQSHVNAHNLHLLSLMQQEANGIAHWDEKRMELLQHSACFVEEARLAHRYDFVPLFDNATQSHLELISNSMRRDLESAVTSYKETIQAYQ